MKTLHYSIIAILVSCLTVGNPIFADNDSVPHLNVATTDYGGNGIMVNSNQTMSPFLPSPPLGMYPYTSKISSVFQIDPEIVHPNGTSSIHILVTNNANFTLYDVNLGESVNDSKSMLFSNIHKIDILNPNQTKTIYGTLHVSADVQPTDYYDIWWNVVAKNQTGNMMESMQFHRNLPVTQNLPLYCCDKLVTITLESPLKQFKSGIKAKDVTCKEGLQLVIKSEDGSPACVKHDTATKLVTRGWSKVMSTIENTNLNTLSENGCGQFYTAPGNQDNKKVPVLLMNSNSTGCTRLTFTIIYNYHDTPWPRIANFPPLGIVGNTNHVTHGDTFSVTPGKDFTNSFQITVMPQTVDLTNYPIGSNFTVTYIIKPLPNATGFYDHSIPKLACERYPLAVGYTANQVNYSDFSYIDPLNPPCGSGPYKLTEVEISGMNYKQVELGSHP